jgi:hypothetical protein
LLVEKSSGITAALDAIDASPSMQRETQAAAGPPAAAHMDAGPDDGDDAAAGRPVEGREEEVVDEEVDEASETDKLIHMQRERMKQLQREKERAEAQAR